MTRQIWNGASILAAMLAASPLFASDHLDTPSVIADPRADVDFDTTFFRLTAHFP